MDSNDRWMEKGRTPVWSPPLVGWVLGSICWMALLGAIWVVVRR